MTELLRLLATLATERKTHVKPGLVARAAYAAAAGFLAMLALVCALIALWIYMVPLVGAAGAPLVVAGVLLLLALILFAMSRRRRVVVLEETVRERRVMADANGLFRDNKGALLLALFTAAFQGGARR